MRDAAGEVAVGSVEDDGRDVVMLGGEVDGERRADALAEEDDLRRREVAGGDEPGERGV